MRPVVAFLLCGAFLLASGASAQTVDDASSTLKTRPTPAAAGTDASAEPAYRSDPKFQKALEATKGRMTAEDRLDNWKHANKAAKGVCVECLHAMITWGLRLAAWKDVVTYAQQLEALNAGQKESMFAEASRGEALLHYNYGNPKPAELAQAEAAFTDVLAHTTRDSTVVFEQGRVLAMEGKDDQAKVMFAKYVDMVPASDKMRMRAERFSDDPHMATMPMAPPFKLVTAQGEQLQLDDMNGKVVLLDFWATWCGPCKETLPSVARLANDYKNDPMLVVISVSSDSDADAWQKFVQKNNMTWPQYRDANGSLSKSYGVDAIPRFFSIDTNGILKSQKVGSDTDIRGMVSDLLKKAHKAEAQKAKESEKAGQ